MSTAEHDASLQKAAIENVAAICEGFAEDAQDSAIAETYRRLGANIRALGEATGTHIQHSSLAVQAEKLAYHVEQIRRLCASISAHRPSERPDMERRLEAIERALMAYSEGGSRDAMRERIPWAFGDQ